MRFSRRSMLSASPAPVLHTAHIQPRNAPVSTVIEVESRDWIAAALTDAISRPRRTMFLARRRQVAILTRCTPAPRSRALLFASSRLIKLERGSSSRSVLTSCPKKLFKLLLVAASLQLVEERGQPASSPRSSRARKPLRLYQRLAARHRILS